MEFEVGKALYGLLNAGFIHRIGKSAVAAAPVLSEGRVEEHRNLGIAFYKTGMLDEALREFRRVLELRGNDAIGRFYVGLVFARQHKWDDAVAAFSRGRGAARREDGRVSQSRIRATSSSIVTTKRARRSTKPCAAAARAIRACRRRSGVVEPARRRSSRRRRAALVAARPLFGNKPPTAAWFHYMGLAAALLGDSTRAATILNEGAAAHPHAAVLLNNLAAVLERAADYDDARAMVERGIQEDAGHSAAAQESRRPALPRRPVRRGARGVPARHEGRIPSSAADVYLKLGNIRLRRQERDEAVRCWERALELDPDNAIVRTNLESVRQVF